MKKILSKFFNLAFLEMLISASSEDVLFAQHFDLPPQKVKDIIANEFEKQNPSLEDQFNTYHYLDAGYHDVKDEYGIIVYTTNEIKHFLHKEIPIEYIKEFKKIKQNNNNPLFDSVDIVKFYQNAITTGDLSKVQSKVKQPDRKKVLKKLYKNKYKTWRKCLKRVHPVFRNKYNFHTLYSLSLIKRSYEYYIDTEKPNLLITYPKLDKTKAFFTPSARKLIKTLQEQYDIWFVTLSHEKELYEALKQVPNIELLIISGHGSKQNIALDKYDEDFGELLFIDINDKELRNNLEKLQHDATIFLNACETGYGQDSMKNLANNFADFAPGKKIIASTAAYSISEISINNVYPLDLSIPGKTYIVKK